MHFDNTLCTPGTTSTIPALKFCWAEQQILEMAQINQYSQINLFFCHYLKKAYCKKQQKSLDLWKIKGNSSVSPVDGMTNLHNKYIYVIIRLRLRVMGILTAHMWPTNQFKSGLILPWPLEYLLGQYRCHGDHRYCWP